MGVRPVSGYGVWNQQKTKTAFYPWGMGSFVVDVKAGVSNFFI
jgi:hypothetical protein